jgi:hypothetical protein
MQAPLRLIDCLCLYKQTNTNEAVQGCASMYIIGRSERRCYLSSYMIHRDVMQAARHHASVLLSIMQAALDEGLNFGNNCASHSWDS